MDIKAIGAGKIPDAINVVIEIPAFSAPIKYEVDKDSGAILVDRFLATAMSYPWNYGFVPCTLSEDGDPVDVLVPTPWPLVPGAVIPARPIGILEMEDEKGVDHKILAMPADKLGGPYKHIQDITDVATEELDRIKHFFEHYKDLEKGKWVKVRNLLPAAEAKKEIMASAERFQ